MKRIMIIILLFCCLFLTCRGVLFDADIMASAMLSSKLRSETTIGPVRINMNNCVNFENSRLMFIPDKNNFNTGFFVIQEGSQLIFRYINSAGQASNNEIRLPVMGMSEKEPNYLIESIAGAGVSGYLLYINYFASGGVSRSRYNFIYYDSYFNNVNTAIMFDSGDNLGDRLFSDSAMSLYVSAVPFINGAYICPQTQQLHFLCSQTSPLASGDYVYFDFVYDLFPTSFSYICPTYSSYYVILPVDSNYDFYYGYDFNKAQSWVSYPNSSGSFSNYYWKDLLYNGIKASSAQPIQKLLTTSEFLSFDNNTAELNSLGSLKRSTFPFGKDLYFAYEIAGRTPGEYDSIITHVIMMSAEDCESVKCNFRVYSYPTTRFGEL